jgi:hypothetical protein
MRTGLDDLPVAPAIVIASGSPGHLHAYWPLAIAVSVAAAEQGNRRLAAQLHGDSGAVTNAATILRPPGSYSFKTTPPIPVVTDDLRCLARAPRTQTPLGFENLTCRGFLRRDRPHCPS